MKKAISFLSFLLALCFYGHAQDGGLQQGLALKYLVQLPAAQTAHAPVIVLLHGYGSDERDLFELRKSFPGKYLVVSARAPYAVAAQGYQWFEPGNNSGKTAEVDNSRKLVLQFIKEVTAKYKADAKEVYIIGFSQGAMMCYEAGLTKPGSVKGIGVLSGRIFPALKQEVEHSAALKQLRIFISHGSADNRISFADGKAAYDYLQSIGLNPAFHEYAGMGHAISNDVMNDLLKWLDK